MSNKSLKDEIESTLGPARWSELGREIAKDSIIIVSSKLDLVDMAMLVARDDADQIKELIKNGSLVKPSEEIVKDWGEEDPELTCVIVKPFILVQK